MSRILVDQVRSNSASGDAITLDGNGKCAINATTINSLTFPTSDGSANQLIKTNGSGALSFETVAGGLTEIDLWRISSTFQGGANPITSNWERGDSNGEAKLGTGMTESSGVFSFPSTGYWHITFHSNFYAGTDYNSCIVYLKVSIDGGSNYSDNTDGYSDLYQPSSNGYGSAEATQVLKVTSTSDFKMTFGVSGEQYKYSVGGSSQNHTYVIFQKLADI